MQSGKGRAESYYPAPLPRTVLRAFPPTAVSPPPHPVSSRRGASRAPPPRVCALAKGWGSGALTPGGRGGRAEGERGLGLAGAARGGRGGKRGDGCRARVGAGAWAALGARRLGGGGRRQQHGGRARAAQPSSSRLSSPPPESLGPFSLRVLVVSPLPPRQSSGLPSLPFTATASPSVGPAGNSHSHPTHKPAGRDHGGREAGVPLAPTVQRRRRGESVSDCHAQASPCGSSAEGRPQAPTVEASGSPESCCLLRASRDPGAEPRTPGLSAQTPVTEFLFS